MESSADPAVRNRSFKRVDESYIHHSMIALMLLALAGGLFNRWHSGKGIRTLA